LLLKLGIIELSRHNLSASQKSMATLTRGKQPNKSSQAMTILHQMADEVGPDGKLPTFLELCKMLGVSRTTLDTALDTLESQRVIYRRQGAGIYAASVKVQSTIALVCNPMFFQGSTHSPFWDVLLREARDRAQADDLSFEVHFSRERKNSSVPFSDNLTNLIQNGGVQAILGVGLNNASYSWLVDRNIHYVSFGCPSPYVVGLDFASLIQQGVQALSEAGCRRIALILEIMPYRKYLASDSSHSNYSELFRNALTQYGLEFDSSLVKVNDDLIQEPARMTTLSKQEQGYRSARQLFEDKKMKAPDGILVIDDMIAVGVLAALSEMNIRLGHDIHFATHTNRGTDVLSTYYDGINRLEIDTTQIVNVMFSTVLDLLRKKKPEGYSYDSTCGWERFLIRPVLHQP
jgi:DNA-binding LacI/PurR family transcriptional regulator